MTRARAIDDEESVGITDEALPRHQDRMAVHASGLSFDLARVRTLPEKLTGVGSALAALIVVALTPPAHAQTPDLGTAADFAVLAGSTVTNTGPSVLIGNLGVSPGTAVIGFPPGIVTPPGATHAANAVAGQAQVDLTTAYNALSGRPTTADLTGQNLGGRTLVPGVYNFNSSAQLTGALTLNALGNPNAVFIFNIASTLTTASASSVTVIGGGQGTNVFWRVGSSATLGSATTFVGDILALTSITLVTGANITCGAALARNGAVTLDTNNIAIGNLAPCTTAPLLPVTPVVVPPGVIPVVIPPGVVVPPGAIAVVIPPGGAIPPGAILIAAPPGSGLPPGSFAVLLPPDVAVPAGAIPALVLGPGVNLTPSAVANAINGAFLTAVNSGTVPFSFPQEFLNLAALSPAAQANALTQLSGEAGTGIAPAGIQSMNSFLSLVLNPFAGMMFAQNPSLGPTGPAPAAVRSLGFAPESPLSPAAVSAYASFNKAPTAPTAPTVDPRLWGIWAAAYGVQNNTSGDALAGTHDRTARAYGFATGLDYRVTRDTVVGFALGGGGTNYGLSDGLGGGHSDLVQAALYGSTRFDAAYVSAAVAYAFHSVTTDRYLTALSGDHLTADFSANNIGGRIEAGYRFVLPSIFGLPRYGFIPYAAAQAQAFYVPSYNEGTVFGQSVFALEYAARTTTAYRTELGAWFDWSVGFDNGTALTLLTRAAWAHNESSDPTVIAFFQSLPGSNFTVIGANPARNSALLSAAAWLRLMDGWSLGAKFDGEFADRSQTYAGMGMVRYTW